MPSCLQNKEVQHRRKGKRFCLESFPAVGRSSDIQDRLSAELGVGVVDADAVPALEERALEGYLHHLHSGWVRATQPALMLTFPESLRHLLWTACPIPKMLHAVIQRHKELLSECRSPQNRISQRQQAPNG